MFGISYLKIAGVAAVVLALGGAVLYVEHLKAARDAALVQVATLQATNNELQAVHDNDVKAIAEITAAKAAAEAALTADAAQQQVVTNTVVQWKEKVVHVPVASTACRGADARDVATLDGLRHILTAAAPHPDAGGQGAAAGGADSGHPAPGPAGPDLRP